MVTTLMTLNNKPVQLSIHELFDGFDELHFITFSFSTKLIEELQKHLSIQGIIGCSFNKSLLDNSNFVYYDNHTHIKLYLLKNKLGHIRIITGSANLSYQGLDYKSSQAENIIIIDNNQALYNRYEKYYQAQRNKALAFQKSRSKDYFKASTSNTVKRDRNKAKYKTKRHKKYVIKKQNSKPTLSNKPQYLNALNNYAKEQRSKFNNAMLKDIENEINKFRKAAFAKVLHINQANSETKIQMQIVKHLAEKPMTYQRAQILDKYSYNIMNNIDIIKLYKLQDEITNKFFKFDDRLCELLNIIDTNQDLNKISKMIDSNWDNIYKFDKITKNIISKYDYYEAIFDNAISFKINYNYDDIIQKRNQGIHQKMPKLQQKRNIFKHIFNIFASH